MFTFLRNQKRILLPRRNSQTISFLFEQSKDLFKLIELGRISSGLIHDLMGPLTALTIYTSRLEAKNSYTQALIESSKQIEEMLGLIREYFQSETQNTPIPVYETIHDASLLLRHKAMKTNVRLIIIGENHTCKVHGVKLFFQQIIINLLSNAIDAYKTCPQEQQDVIVQIEQKKKCVEIRIKDFGCGISKSNQEKIFDCFYSDKKDGTGIGLSFVHHLITKYFNGTISVTSKKGEGSVFCVHIPT